MLLSFLAPSALLLGRLAAAQQQADTFSFLTFSPSPVSQPLLQLAGPNAPPELRVSPDDFAAVRRAVSSLGDDFGRVLGTKAAVVNTTTSTTSSAAAPGRPAIIIGTLKASSVISQLVASKAIDVAAIEGKWESFVWQAVPSLNALVVAGSDVRGTIFGVYALSEALGVSPWYWWADVAPAKRQYVGAPAQGRLVQGPPSVKFRGIFLNDESPALSTWAKGNYPTSQYGNSFNADFYARIFELVLRLKGNYVWPAMWNSMFYLEASGAAASNDFAVFMGTSHHEPMARADKEQGRFCQGAWDWGRNKANVQKFMSEGAKRAKDWFTVFTVGMRGSGDAASATLNSKQLEEIIAFQESTLKSTIGKDLSEIPHSWMMYKEVPGYWQKGMNISDDVTLVWTDDNRGNIRRIPTAKELTRRGGSGMYYHFDYVGAPRNYKWINTIQLQKTWEQMHLAHERGIRQLWIVNVGDLKPMEIPTAHFMAMAYDMSAFTTPDSTYAWLTSWCGRQFGTDAAAATADIMTTYGTLTARRKYEDLSITPFAFSVDAYDEAERNMAEWTALLDATQAVYNKLPAEVQPSFFETVLHPVSAGKTVFEIYTNAALGAKYAAEGRLAANELAQRARDAFARDGQLQKQFHTMLGGKWNHMMDQTHIGYNNWQEPGQNSLPPLKTVSTTARPANAKPFGVGVQSVGKAAQAPDAATITLLPMDNYMSPAETRWIDVFLRGTGSTPYAITSNASYVSVSGSGANSTGGTLSSTTPGPSQQRATVSIDWASAPAGASTAQLTVKAGTASTAVNVALTKRAALPADFAQGHVESGGVVSIEASRFASTTPPNSYVRIPALGRTLGSAKLWPVTTPPQPPSGGGACLLYPFYTFTPSGTGAKATVYLSASENADSEHANGFVLAVDEGKASVVQPVPPIASDAGSEPAGWDNAVTSNAWVRDVQLGAALGAGKHTLKVCLLQPTMALAKVVLDLGTGAAKASELGPPESWYVGGS